LPAKDLVGSTSDTLSAAETAALLQLNVKRVQALARAGQIPATRVGRKWLFPRRRIEQMVGVVAEPATAMVELSARNQLTGRILAIQADGIMAEVRLDLGGQQLVAVITRSSVDRLRLKVGDDVLAVIKSTEVMIGRGSA
jgi:molybdopterin-binding protein